MKAVCYLGLLLILPAGSGLVAGCIKAPDVVLMDQKTALEIQAAGEYHPLEYDLIQAGLSPKATELPQEQLEAFSHDSKGSTLGDMIQLYSRVQTDSAWTDQMLLAGCIGESLNGLLQTTPEQCTQEVDTGQSARIVGRTNLHRRQMWQLIQKQYPGKTEEQIMRIWREIHLKRVVCGGLIQTGENTWEKKPC